MGQLLVSCAWQCGQCDSHEPSLNSPSNKTRATDFGNSAGPVASHCSLPALLVSCPDPGGPCQWPGQHLVCSGPACRHCSHMDMTQRKHTRTHTLLVSVSLAPMTADMIQTPHAQHAVRQSPWPAMPSLLPQMIPTGNTNLVDTTLTHTSCPRSTASLAELSRAELMLLTCTRPSA